MKTLACGTDMWRVFIPGANVAGFVVPGVKETWGLWWVSMFPVGGKHGDCA